MRRAALFVGIVWLAAACPSAPAREVSPDAGTDAGPDAATDAGCAAIVAAVAAELEMPQPCDAGSDCTFVNTGCGLAGVCGAIVDTAVAAVVDPLASQFIALDCPINGICPDCPRGPAGAYCQQGVCQAAENPAGQPCTTAADCPSLFLPDAGLLCLTDGGFTNGDCVLPCIDGGGCAQGGLHCMPLPGAPDAPGACFPECTIDSDCRASDGFACCPIRGQGEGAGSVCYPAPCPT